MIEIGHVAAPLDGSLFVTAEFEHRVRLWSLESCSLLSEMETVLEYGGRRLALCEPTAGSPVIVAAAWARHGICGYAADGMRLWQRKDLGRVQQISPIPDGAHVTACFDERPMHVLAARSGHTVATVRGVRRFWPSRFESVGVAATNTHVVLVDTEQWTIRWKRPVKALSWSILSAAAAPQALLVGGVFDTDALSCLGLDGTPLWQERDLGDAAALALGWDDELAEWVGVVRAFNGPRPAYLTRWSRDGNLTFEHPLSRSRTYALLADAHLLVCGGGLIRDTRDATVVWQLPPVISQRM